MTFVAVSGPVTMDTVARWHGQLSDVLARGQGLRLDLEGAGPWDLAGVQLLLATMATSKRSGRPIVLAHVPNVLIAIAERAALRDELAAITVDQVLRDS